MANLTGKISDIFIGVHMRRGDFVYETSQLKGYVPATIDYYHKSIEFYENMFQNNSTKLLFLVSAMTMNGTWKMLPIRLM